MILSAMNDNSAIASIPASRISEEESRIATSAGNNNGHLNLLETAAKEGGAGAQTAMDASKDNAPAAEIVDVKPTLKELEIATGAAVLQVRDEDRLEGCVSFR